MYNKVKEKQKELKSWIAKIGMKEKEFSTLYCEHIYVEPSENDISRFNEKFKKELLRDTTKEEVLEKYFIFLYSLEEFKAIDYIKQTYVSDESFSDKFNERMKKISTDITNKLIEEEND